MKLKTLLLSLFLLLSTSVFAESNESCLTSADVERKDGLYYLVGQDNPFTGTSKCVYSGGRIESLGEIKNGKREGKWTEWYTNGQMQSEGNYKDGKQDGKLTGWHANGQIRSEINFKDGKLNGKWTWWYESGQLKSEKNFKDGKRKGKRVE